MSLKLTTALDVTLTNEMIVVANVSSAHRANDNVRELLAGILNMNDSGHELYG